jgi:hypothetical protein
MQGCNCEELKHSWHHHTHNPSPDHSVPVAILVTADRPYSLHLYVLLRILAKEGSIEAPPHSVPVAIFAKQG